MNRQAFYAPYNDGLRAIAVMSVIAYHLNAKWLPGGFAGVDVFFVISGFVVATSVSSLESLSLPKFLLYFYARRLVRITPALVACLLATFLASGLFIPEAWLSDANQKTGYFAFIGLSNFVLAHNTGNYFSPTAEYNPFTHTWSLAVEEQFYLIFPLLFFAWLSGKPGKRALSITLLTACFAASLICSAWLGRVDQTQAFYMIWSRFWELGAGVLLFQLLSLRGHSFTESSPYRPRFAWGAVLAVCALAAGLVLARPGLAPFPSGLLPTLGTVGLLGFLHGRTGGIVEKLLTLRIMRFIGRISYSLYLWHWPVFVLFRWTAGLDSPICRAAALLLTVLLSVTSFYLIETPPRQAARRFPRVGVVAAGLVLVASGFVVSVSIAGNQQSLTLSTVVGHADEWYPQPAATNATYQGCAINSNGVDVGGSTVWVEARSGCNAPVSFPHHLFVIGDSHASAYSGMLKRFAAQTGATVYAYSNGGCGFIGLRQPRYTRSDCDQYGDAAVQDVLAKIKPGDVVFLPSLRLPRMVDQGAFFGEQDARAAILGPEADAGRVDGEAKAIPILKAFTARGARVVFEGPTPLFESIAFLCADWFNRSNPMCAHGDSVPRSLMDEFRQPVLQSYAHLEAAVPNVTVWDPFPILCPGQVCSNHLGSKPLFFDGDHLSEYSNTMLLPYFSAFMLGQIHLATRTE